ncbi:beta-galactosidase-1-like protein 2 [Platysternon megacephalum]|uniref:Chitinase-3-like protein 1 n=1 Tax=Platysternon megacephalum TaxID=55544 RepID=A0A4D9EAK8_9SAUR|nr:beta-galactosidase-1-like protein 2 [Platysternon megacephalum]
MEKAGTDLDPLHGDVQCPEARCWRNGDVSAAISWEALEFVPKHRRADNAVRHWKRKGAPGEKIIMGIPTYGRSFTLDTLDTGVGAQASKAGQPGPFTSEAGFLAYYEICTFKQGATTEMIEEQKVPYSYKGNQWVGYDDMESIKTKTKFQVPQVGSVGWNPSLKTLLSIDGGKTGLDRAVDFLNLLTFDFHGSWQKVTGHVSPFLQGKEDSKSSSYYNVDYAVTYWRSKGAPAEKLIMGIPTYGRSFTLSSSKTGIGAPISGPGSPVPFTQEAGLLAYYEICTFTPGATTERIVEQEVPYSYKGNQWVGYDDEQSITTKVQYLKNNKLGGAMIWAVDLDDFDGLFCSQKKPYPLIGTVKAKLSSGN